MAYTTLVAGTTITSAWANANVRDQVITPFASAAARDSAITSPVEGIHAYLTDTDKLTAYNGSAWVPATSNIVARQTITSNSSSITADTATDFTLSVPVNVARLYRVALKTQVSITGTPGDMTLQLFVDGVDTDRFAAFNTTGRHTVATELLWEPTTGTKTVEVRVDEIGDGLTMVLEALATGKRQFWVEDIGPR